MDLCGAKVRFGVCVCVFGRPCNGRARDVTRDWLTRRGIWKLRSPKEER